MLVLKLCVLFVTGVTVGRAWFDEEQLELFDLVEEVKDNFYEFMELNQTATTSDIKRAFRQLSLRLHPDKNDEPDAEIKFRHLVSISDVLRDESKRKKYDEILVNGLPNWRSGMYYIRRARKLGLLEMSIIVSVILTLGHYLCLVAAYYEKLFEVNEVLRRKEKKLKQSDYDVLYQETLDSNGIRKPKILHDNLPVKTVLGVFYLIVHYIPSAIRSAIEKRNERRRLLEEEAEEKAYLEQQSQAEANRPKRVRAKIELPEYSDETPFVLNSAIKSEKSKDDLKIKRGIWSDEEVHQLVKLTKKFPGAIPQRWERIAVALGRELDDVTKKAKTLKSFELKTSETLLEKKSNVDPKVTDDISKRDIVSEWTQDDQMLFEKALSQFSKDVTDRWDRISESVPGKSKRDCILRYKELVEQVKKKKSEK